MSDAAMKLVVVGAAGRMGQTLIRLIHSIEGVKLHAAVERTGSPFVGKDAGEIAGLGPTDVIIGDDPLQAFLHADGVLDFTSPAATVEFSGLAAQARIVHVIGTTGCSADDDARIAAAARHARIVKSGNMSLGVNLLSVLTRQAARALEPSDWDIEILEMHHKHKVDAPSGTALLLGEAAAKGRNIDLASKSVRVRDGHTAPARRARSASRHCAAAPSSANIPCFSPAKAKSSRCRIVLPTARSSRAAPSRRHSGPATRSRGSIPCSTCSGFLPNKDTTEAYS